MHGKKRDLSWFNFVCDAEEQSVNKQATTDVLKQL